MSAEIIQLHPENSTRTQEEQKPTIQQPNTIGDKLRFIGGALRDILMNREVGSLMIPYHIAYGVLKAMDSGTHTNEEVIALLKKIDPGDRKNLQYLFSSFVRSQKDIVYITTRSLESPGLQFFFRELERIFSLGSYTRN